MSSGKSYFIESLKNSPDKTGFVRTFCEQYHYFSQHQIIAFSKLMQLLPPSDNESLALVASVLYDELGRGEPAGVHSVLFSRFANKFGADTGLPASSIVAGVKDYVLLLHEAFGGKSLPAALATYWFLEKSAVETYDPVLALMKESFPELSEKDLEFFILHTCMEPEHEKAATAMCDRLLSGTEDNAAFRLQVQRMDEQWEKFWTDITNRCLNQ